MLFIFTNVNMYECAFLTESHYQTTAADSVCLV